MFKTFKNAFKIPELRSKILFTLFIIILYRIGSVIPVPFTNVGELGAAYSQTGILTYLSMLSGSAFAQGTLFALGVSPYITAQIVIQLLTIAIPALERLAQNGEDGRKKINKITRYVTVVLSVITGIGYYLIMENQYGLVKKGYDNAFGIIVIIACYVAGASIVMWLGEKIDEQGIGNGISILLFANIVSGLPQQIMSYVATLQGSKQAACTGYHTKRSLHTLPLCPDASHTSIKPRGKTQPIFSFPLPSSCLHRGIHLPEMNKPRRIPSPGLLFN